MRVTEALLKTNPKGIRLAKNVTNVPTGDGWDFVIGQCFDGAWGSDLNDLGEYVNPYWSTLVDNAAEKGALLIAQCTFRVQGNEYPVDILDPSKDRQLQGALYGLLGHTVHGILLNIVPADSESRVMEVTNHFNTQLKKVVGLETFMVVSENGTDIPYGRVMAWKHNVHLDTAIAEKDSNFKLAIIMDYEKEIGAPIETPGNRDGSELILWENVPGQFIMSLPKLSAAIRLGVTWPGTEEPGPGEEPEPGEEEPTGGSVTLDLSGLIALMQPISEFFEKLLVRFFGED